MFDVRELPPALDRLRERHAPDALVLDCARDFETLPSAAAEALGPLVASFDPVSYPAEWLPDDAPDALTRYASDAFTVGMPGDGGIAWTRQTDPPTVFVKPRLEGSPEPFVEFLIAEALVQAGDPAVDEQFLPFFGARYRELAAATPLPPADTYQLAAALHEAHVGLQARPTFAAWDDEFHALHEAWRDAGERLRPRVAGLPGEVTWGETGFATAAELACSAVKHGLDLPAPFSALDTSAYGQHGAAYAVRWAEKTFAALGSTGDADG